MACTLFAMLSVMTLSSLSHSTRGIAAEPQAQPTHTFLVECRLDQTENGKTETISAPRMMVHPASTATAMVGSKSENFEAKVTTGTLQPGSTHQIHFQMTRQGDTIISPRLQLVTDQTGHIEWTSGARSYKFTCKVSKN